MRLKTEEAMKKVAEKDNSLREKDEKLFEASWAVENHKSDLKNLNDICENLRNEIQFINGRWQELENVNSVLKNQLCENSILIRQISFEMDAWNRDILALSKNIEIFKKNEDNLWNENSQLKDLIMNIESNRIDVTTKYENC